MKSAVAQCSVCRAKFSAARARCPRCRAVLPVDNPAAAAIRSRRFGWASAGVFVGFALMLGLLWYANRTDATAIRAGSGASAAAEAADDFEPVFIAPATLGAAAGHSELQESHALYERHVADHPRDPDARLALARVQVQLGRTERAIATLQTAIDLAPERWQNRALLAYAQCAASRWDECIGSLRRARELAPEDPVICHNLGVALHRRNADAAAVEAYERARTLRPGEPRTQLGLAVSLEKAGRPVDAIRAYEEYLRLRGDGAAGEKVRARINALSDRPSQ
jgi:tetratricopeptide (TPR) repeat protein